MINPEHLRLDFVQAVENKVGTPFKRGGVEKDGYDCSGLIVAGLCEVLNITPAEYPEDLRTLTQISQNFNLVDLPSVPGDIFVKYDEIATHAFVFVGGRSFVHSGRDYGVKRMTSQKLFDPIGYPRIKFVDYLSRILEKLG